MPNKQRQLTKQEQHLTQQQLLVQRLLRMPLDLFEQTVKAEVENNVMLQIEETNAADSVVDGNLSEVPVIDNGLVYNEDEGNYAYTDNVYGSSNERAIMNYVGSKSLVSSLEEQLNFLTLSDRQRELCGEIVGSINNAGYLSRDLALIVNDLVYMKGVEYTDAEAEEALRIVQHLEPAGVGARNLRECLLLQLRRMRRNDLVWRNAVAIIDECFDDFANRNYKAIKEKLMVDDETLEQVSELIRSLDPKPGGGDDTTVMNIVPDFIVAVEGDDVSFSLTKSNMPEIHLDKDNLDLLHDSENGSEESMRQTARYLRQQTEAANSFIEAVRERYKTMANIMAVIVALQRDFFVSGDTADLHPMTITKVAEMAGYDASTVSRMVNSKYASTSFGTILLRQCFSSSVETEDGDDVTMAAIKEQIKKLIDNEDKASPLTDQNIADQLQSKGYKLSRRTVAKYRESLGIEIMKKRKHR